MARFRVEMILSRTYGYADVEASSDKLAREIAINLSPDELDALVKDDTREIQSSQMLVN